MILKTIESFCNVLFYVTTMIWNKKEKRDFIILERRLVKNDRVSSHFAGVIRAVAKKRHVKMTKKSKWLQRSFKLCNDDGG